MNHSSDTNNSWGWSLGGNESSLLGEVLESYMAALERGERPDRDELVNKYPDIATELRDCLAKLDALRLAAVGFEDASGIAHVDVKSRLAFSRLGDFHIRGELGRGGMGVVYAAEQLTLNRRVALKTLPFTSLLDDRRIARFKNESIAAASLNHPHIVPIYAVGCEMGVHYYAMQCIDGGSLADIIAIRHGDSSVHAPDETRDSLSESTLVTASSDGFYRSVAETGRQAAEALQHAHEQGVLHRDIKPSNLLIDSTGHIWVTDFGLAATQSDTALTHSGELIGTLRYLSPEQAAGKVPVDHRTDIYGLGVTLYELLAGTPAHPSGDRGQLIRDVLDTQPRSIRHHDLGVPSDLATVISRAMAKDRDERYATAGELASDLIRFLNDQPVVARRPSIYRKTISWIRRNRTVAALVSAIVIVLAAAAIGGVTYASRLAKEQQKLQVSLYARDIALAQQLIARGDHVRAEAILLNWMQSSQRSALRDFEWFYLWRQCQNGASDAVLRTPADAWDAILLDKHNLIATSAMGTTIPILDANTYEPIDERSLDTNHQAEITKLAVDPTRQILASGGVAGLVCLWRIVDGELLSSFEVENQSHGNGIRDLCFSPDGQYLAASTYDERIDRKARHCTISIWDIHQKRITKRISGLGSRTQINFFPTGQMVVTSLSAEVEVWDSSIGNGGANDGDWQQVYKNALGGKPIWCSKLTNDGKHLVTASCDFSDEYSTIEVWDTQTWQRTARFDARIPGQFNDIDTTGNRWVLLGSSLGHVTLLDLKTSEIAVTRKIHHGSVRSVSFSDDEQLILSASADGTIRFWDRQRFMAKDTAKFLERTSTHRISGAVYANPGRIYIAHHDGEIIEWDIHSGLDAGRIKVDSPDSNRTAITVSPDGQRLAVVCQRWPVGGVAHVEVHVPPSLSADSRQWRAELSDGAVVAVPKFSPDGEVLAVPSLRKIRLFDASNGRMMHELPVPWAWCLAFTSEGRVFAASRKNVVHFFQTSDWTLQRSLQVANSDVRAIAFCQDGELLATSDSEHRVTLRHVPSGRVLERSEPLSDYIMVLDYSPNERRIAAITKDGLVHVMQSRNLDIQLTLPFPPRWTFQGGFSPDGNQLIVGADLASRVFEAGPINESKLLNVKQLRGERYRQLNFRFPNTDAP